VVRHLLRKNKLLDPVEVELTSSMKNTDDTRFVFDSTISPWLNEANKQGYINNFSYLATSVKFNIEHDKLESLKNILPLEFKL
jgi:hypothetical protein